MVLEIEFLGLDHARIEEVQYLVVVVLCVVVVGVDGVDNAHIVKDCLQLDALFKNLKLSTCAGALLSVSFMMPSIHSINESMSTLSTVT